MPSRPSLRVVLFLAVAAVGVWLLLQSKDSVGGMSSGRAGDDAFCEIAPCAKRGGAGGKYRSKMVGEAFDHALRHLRRRKNVRMLEVGAYCGTGQREGKVPNDLSNVVSGWSEYFSRQGGSLIGYHGLGLWEQPSTCDSHRNVGGKHGPSHAVTSKGTGRPLRDDIMDASHASGTNSLVVVRSHVQRWSDQRAVVETALQNDDVLTPGGVLLLESVESAANPQLAGGAGNSMISFFEQMTIRSTRSHTAPASINYRHDDAMALKLYPLVTMFGCFHGGSCFIVKHANRSDTAHGWPALASWSRAEVQADLRDDTRKSFCDVASGTTSDKCVGHRYGAAYDWLLWPYEGTSRRMIEIGLGCTMSYAVADKRAVLGSSFKLWPHYLGDSTEYFTWIEYDKECVEKINPADLVIPGLDTKIEVHAGDQCDVRDLRKVSKTSNNVDVVVDDGGHSWAQQLNTLRYYLLERHALAKHGMIIIEDLATSYLGLHLVPFEYDDTVRTFRSNNPTPDREEQAKLNEEGLMCGYEDMVNKYGDLPVPMSELMARLMTRKALASVDLPQFTKEDNSWATKQLVEIEDKIVGVGCYYDEICYVLT